MPINGELTFPDVPGKINEHNQSPNAHSVRIDNTVSQSGMAADAKATRDLVENVSGQIEEEIDALDGQVTDLKSALLHNVKLIPWEIGGYNSDGTPSDATNRLRTKNLITKGDFIGFDITAGDYEATLYVWNGDSYVGRLTANGFSATGTIKYVTTYTFDTTLNYIYHVVLRRTDGGTMDEAIKEDSIVSFRSINVFNRYGLVGDGITDDTQNLQKAVNSNKAVELPDGFQIKISDTIEIDPSVCNLIEGNNSKIIVSGDFSAFKITGTQQASANPSQASSKAIRKEANITLRNLKITCSTQYNGTGIELSNVLKVNIINCYLFFLKRGVVFTDTCRDCTVIGNHFYACHDAGIEIANDCNVHQLNICANVINYSKYCIYANNSITINNMQITGNDIEISTTPDDVKSVARAIYLDGTNSQFELAEIEIVGNTLQGHGASEAIVEIDGGTGSTVRSITFTGNYLSSSTKYFIILSGASNVSISGNAYNRCYHHVFKVSDINNVIISNESCVDCGGIVYGTDDIDNLKISDCVISRTNDYKQGYEVWMEADINNLVINGLVSSNGGYLHLVNGDTGAVVISNNLCDVVWTIPSGAIGYNNYPTT